MHRDEIATRLMSFLQEEFPNPGADLTETTNLLDEWFVDSLGIIETVLFLEKTFELDIQRADINGNNFRDVATLSGFVATRLNGSPHG